MSEINVLSSKIFNRIAAGEVVERPASVVKELVENSIDAKANKIQIEIENGGISTIKIIDNGHGIEKSQLKKALLPHATSKISKLSDLDNILTLGFRGEALASIASVSKITILSKPKTQDFGAKISSNGGDTQEVEDFGCNDGTEIIVNNLFYNTPVREKFLKSERSEEGEITATIARFILGNPSVAFKYVADGKTIYQSYGDGFESAMASVYGVDVINECFKVDTERHGVTISGYLGKHHFTKGNRSYQTVFVNGRYIVNQTVSSAINNAYSTYMMKRQYPFFVLNVNLPTEIVDVNVHPNKLDVRFSNNQIVYGTLYSVVSKVLDGSSEVLNIVKEEKSKEINNVFIDKNVTQNLSNKDLYDVKISHQSKNYEPVVFNDSGAKGLPIKENIESKKEEVVDIFAENKAFLEKLEQKKKLASEVVEQDTIKIERELKLIGQALNTFLILEDGQDLYFIDQHAAHERILFDKLLDSFNNGEILTQPLLLPYVLNVNNLEYDFLQSKIDFLAKMGIQIEDFGANAFKVSSVPTFLSEMNIGKFFSLILSEMETLKSIEITDVLFEKLAQKACKSAIKSGDKLSELELKTLTDVLKNNLGLKCPHGRPVAIKITRTEIDKWFKRIV